nr:hypothetical protein [Enterobacter cloacae complex sp.]
MAEESQTEQSRAYFYRNFKYTLEHLTRDYEAELLRYSDDSGNSHSELHASALLLNAIKPTEC